MSTSYSFGKLFRDIESGFSKDRLNHRSAPRTLDDDEWNYYDGQWRRKDRGKPLEKKTLKDFLQERQFRRSPIDIATKIPAVALKNAFQNKALVDQTPRIVASTSRIDSMVNIGIEKIQWSHHSIHAFDDHQTWQIASEPIASMSCDPSGSWSSLSTPLFESTFFQRSGSGICNGDQADVGVGFDVEDRNVWTWEETASSFVVAWGDLDEMDQQSMQGIHWERKSVENFQCLCDISVSVLNSWGCASQSNRASLLQAYASTVEIDAMQALADPIRSLECDSGIIDLAGENIYRFPGDFVVDSRCRMAAA